MKLKLLIFTFLTINILNPLSAGDKLIYGINLGVKFANRQNAIRYTGVYKNQLENYFTNPNNYQYVRTQILNNRDFEFFEYSELYRYQPAFLAGLMVGYQTSPNLSFDADLNFISLIVNSGYTLTIIDPGNTTSQDIYQNGFIRGEETRFNGRINMNYTSDPVGKLSYIIGLSGLFNSWRMDQNIVELSGTVLVDLYSQHNPQNNFTLKVRGNNFGYGINAGIKYKVSDKIDLQLLYQPYINRPEYFFTKPEIENAGTSYTKPKFQLEHDLVTRFIW